MSWRGLVIGMLYNLAALAGFIILAQPWFSARPLWIVGYVALLHVIGAWHWIGPFARRKRRAGKMQRGPSPVFPIKRASDSGAMPEHAVMRLLVDLPLASMRAGAKGTVVAIYSDGKSYEVEFSARASVTVDW